MYVVVTGPPASGKSTLASALASELGLPLIAKDTIKDALVDALGAVDAEHSRRLGRAAVAVLKVVVDQLPGAVIDSVWVDRAAAAHWIVGLPEPVVEVFCRCSIEVLTRRYRERAARSRGGSFDLERTPEELWAPELLQPLAGPWRVVEMDTEAEVNLAQLLARVRGCGRRYGRVVTVRPEIVCLCGSARFMAQIRTVNRELTFEGVIVVAPCEGEESPTPAQKVALDALHLRKIDLADRVVIVNPGGYLGESTKREIAYAQAAGKPVAFTDPV